MRYRISHCASGFFCKISVNPTFSRKKSPQEVEVRSLISEASSWTTRYAREQHAFTLKIKVRTGRNDGQLQLHNGRRAGVSAVVWWNCQQFGKLFWQMTHKGFLSQGFVLATCLNVGFEASAKAEAFRFAAIVNKVSGYLEKNLFDLEVRQLCVYHYFID